VDSVDSLSRPLATDSIEMVFGKQRIESRGSPIIRISILFLPRQLANCQDRHHEQFRRPQMSPNTYRSFRWRCAACSSPPTSESTSLSALPPTATFAVRGLGTRFRRREPNRM
jgi:hypothetical protein